MRPISQGTDFRRRIPVQARAKETIDVILQATAQILEKEGRAALNTNHIAERAGISIGSLYQYFPNKQSILIAIARKEIERDRSVVMNAIGEGTKDDRRVLARVCIRALIASQRKQTKVRRAAFDALLSEGLGQFGSESGVAFRQVTEFIQQNRSRLFSARARQPSPTILFVISRAVIGVIRSAMAEESELLGTPGFEDELVRLIEGFFVAKP